MNIFLELLVFIGLMTSNITMIEIPVGYDLPNGMYYGDGIVSLNEYYYECDPLAHCKDSGKFICIGSANTNKRGQCVNQTLSYPEKTYTWSQLNGKVIK